MSKVQKLTSIFLAKNLFYKNDNVTKIERSILISRKKGHRLIVLSEIPSRVSPEDGVTWHNIHCTLELPESFKNPFYLAYTWRHLNQNQWEWDPGMGMF